MRVVLGAGGTGGHIIPALALARELSKRQRADIHFVGRFVHSSLAMGNEYPYHKISCGPPSIAGLADLAKGTWESWRLLSSLRPDVVVGFGSFYSVPPLLAASFRRVPLVLHEANAVMGRANRLLSRFARKIGAHFVEVAREYGQKGVHVGMPLTLQHPSRKEALAYFGLPPDRPVLLAFGGSQGALFINRLMESIAGGLHVSVLHIAGHAVPLEPLEALYLAREIPAVVKPFEHNMSHAWSAASVALCRAGAATLGEISAHRVKALLIPYPHATDQHQLANARRAKGWGGISWLEEHRVSPGGVVEELEKLLEGKYGEVSLREKPERSLAQLVEEVACG